MARAEKGRETQKERDGQMEKKGSPHKGLCASWGHHPPSQFCLWSRPERAHAFPPNMCSSNARGTRPHSLRASRGARSCVYTQARIHTHALFPLFFRQKPQQLWGRCALLHRDVK